MKKLIFQTRTKLSLLCAGVYPCDGRGGNLNFPAARIIHNASQSRDDFYCVKNHSRFINDFIP
ncbi:MAG: hypothetical protein A2Y10_01535 [Planctomycetes bacterium GWF2_41_51]|nr:MAG: hypothetical protein A2Y10_01535 [Planctomycetes bacterium GWF2_41_51]